MWSRVKETEPGNTVWTTARPNPRSVWRFRCVLRDNPDSHAGNKSLAECPLFTGPDTCRPCLKRNRARAEDAETAQRQRREVDLQIHRDAKKHTQVGNRAHVDVDAL